MGDQSAIDSVKESLWNLCFQPEVFKKAKQQEKSKGVDIALAKDFLGNAFRHNYDVAFLFAGDGDYEDNLGSSLYRLSEKEHLGRVESWRSGYI